MIALSLKPSSNPPCSIMAAVNSVVKVSATCIGSLMPVLSMTTYSTLPSRARRTSSSKRSPRKVQQIQPFWSWINFSLLLDTVCWAMRLASMLSLVQKVSENFRRRYSRMTNVLISLTMTAMRRPWSGDLRMCSSKVVFPLPCANIIKKPKINKPKIRIDNVQITH